MDAYNLLEAMSGWSDTCSQWHVSLIKKDLTSLDFSQAVFWNGQTLCLGMIQDFI